jgi:hypothetical protein
VDLETCLQDASYSSYFRFTAGRVILTLDALFDDGFDGT